ncbi:MAG: phosphonate ABC transporter, permease protein PhnE [Candidatus Celaenobacter antarcticus]|nr:phosphonate ABC transporter, permease protein PhnE [Candidatus Celaenobacter antarcticus]
MKKKNKAKAAIQSIATDLLFWIYIFGCFYYLMHKWTGFTAKLYLIGIAALIATIIFQLVRGSIGVKLFLSAGKVKRSWLKSVWGYLTILSLLITFVVGVNIVGVDFYKFFTKFQNAGGIASGIFDPSVTGYSLSSESINELKKDDLPPDVLNTLGGIQNRRYSTKKVFIHDLEKRLGETTFQEYKSVILKSAEKNTELLNIALSALAETIFLALLATVFAIPIAFVLSFFAARNLMPRTWLGNIVYIIVRTIATIFRSIEAIVWAIIFSVWVGIGPFAGMLALMIHSIASLTKLYSEQIENIDSGPVEAIKATGASTFQTWVYAVIPQIISPYLAFTIYRWDINVRMATIVGFVGGGGIGLLLLQQQQLLRWHNVGLLIWLIAFVVWVMDMASAKVREKLVGM